MDVDMDTDFSKNRDMDVDIDTKFLKNRDTDMDMDTRWHWCPPTSAQFIAYNSAPEFLELKMEDPALLKWTVLLPWVVNPKLSSRSTTIIDFLNGNPLYKCRSTLTQASPFKPKGRSTIVHDRPLWLSRLSALGTVDFGQLERPLWTLLMISKRLAEKLLQIGMLLMIFWSRQTKNCKTERSNRRSFFASLTGTATTQKWLWEKLLL